MKRRRNLLYRAAVIPSALVLVYAALRFLPDPALRRFTERQYSSRFYDRNGTLLYVLPLAEGLRREYVPLEKIPKELVAAFIAAEDKNFYRHCGIDFTSIVRAFNQNRKAARIVSGASTITMQLVRLIHPRKRPPRLAEKAVEMLYAVRIECKLSKRKILELYLSNVPFGFQIEGVASAAHAFYGVQADALSLLSPEEMRTLSLIPRRPASYAPKKNAASPNRWPHFINYVKSEYKRRGKVIPPELTLSIDNELCALLERSMQNKLDAYRNARVHNGSAFAINNRTGEIVAWVGNGSFDDAEHSGQIDGVLVKNQPGSAMKPFLYAFALENGFAPSALLPDISEDFGSSGVYVPRNFNNRFNGPVRLRIALASSLNVPAVHILNAVGIDAYLSALSLLGFQSLDGTREKTGLSLALGSNAVTLFEMVRAFSVFTKDGAIPKELSYTVRHTPAPVTRVYAPDTARILCDMLSDKEARALGFGHAKVFDTPYPCIFKTGTSNQFQNIIALGSTTEYTAGVWMGNLAGETVIGKTGSSIPAQIVRELLDALTAQYGAKTFLPPKLYEKQKICALSGMALGAQCPSAVSEYVKKNTERAPCSWHRKENGMLRVIYPAEYAAWANGKNIGGSAQSGGRLTVAYPKDNAVFLFDASLVPESQMLPVYASGGEAKEAELFVDGKSFGSANGASGWRIPLERGHHLIIVRSGTE